MKKQKNCCVLIFLFILWSFSYFSFGVDLVLDVNNLHVYNNEIKLKNGAEGEKMSLFFIIIYWEGKPCEASQPSWHQRP